MNNKSALFGNSSNVNAPVVATLNVADIKPDPNQARKHFDKTSLKEVVLTIKEKGLIQPITVRMDPDGGYILIAGERRWRAVQLNEMETIQGIVRDDLDARSAGLIENLQRENLKPVEEADAIATLISEDNLSQGDVATMLGLSRASINQLLKIKKLPEDILAESLNLNTSKSILIELTSISDDSLLKRLWTRSKDETLSVAEIRRVRDGAKKAKEANKLSKEKLSTQEKSIRKAFSALEALKDKPLSGAERARLVELQAKVLEILG